jgi:hypothetical protein
MRRTALVCLLLVGATAGLIVRLLPAEKIELNGATAVPSVRGAFHVHTNRSDGTGTPDEIAAAAARAGLDFVVLSDHDTGAAAPTAPYYSSGVLLIEAVEISTEGSGHVVALGMPRAPYPLAGEARDVVEDIRRLGGMAIAAHPGSPKPELRWVEWTAPIDGIEWLNADSEWRDEGRGALVRTLFTYPFRPAGVLAALLDRPEDVLRRWDVLTGRRPVVALAAADAHARVALRSGEPDDASPALPVPSYESMFRAFSIIVAPAMYTGNAAADAATTIAAIRRGHVYSSIDALAGRADVSFTAAAAGSLTFNSGDTIEAGTGNVELRVDSNAPDGAQIVVFKNGAPLVTRRGPGLREIVPGEPATYRVEITLPDAPGNPPVPWVLTNPIYVAAGKQPPAPERPAATEFAPQYENGFAPDWTVETSPRSRAALDVAPAEGGTQLSMRWGLGGTPSESPYAALAMPAGPAFSGYDRLLFTARADRPMRLSVQLRVPSEGDGERWHRSVYLDTSPRRIAIFFDEMTPRGPTTQRRPVLANVRDVLFVVDTVNTRPGTSGQVWIDDVRYGR